MKGYVYVLSNESMPGLVKVGYTEKDPEGRAKELSGETGIPSPFVLEYEILVDNPRQLEQKVHRTLGASRHSERREFFRCSTEKAVIAIKESFGGEAKYEQYHKVERKEIEEAIRAKEEERINRRNAEIQEAETQRLRAEREAEELKEQREQEKQRDFEKHKWLMAGGVIVGLLIVAGGLNGMLVAYSFNSSTTAKATGKIITSYYRFKFLPRNTPWGNGYYVTTYEFKHGSVTYTGREAWGHSKRGESIRVYFNPNNPNTNGLKKRDTFDNAWVSIVGLGLICGCKPWRFFK